jgi:hypothetical protein
MRRLELHRHWGYSERRSRDVWCFGAAGLWTVWGFRCVIGIVSHDVSNSLVRQSSPRIRFRPHLRARRANRRSSQDLWQPNSSSALPPIPLPSHPSLAEDHTRHPYQVPPLNFNHLLDTDPDGSSRRLRVSTSPHSSSRPHRKLIKTLPLWLGAVYRLLAPWGRSSVRAKRFDFPARNRASVRISSQLYDRRSTYPS